MWSLESLEVAHVLKCKGASVYSLAITNKDIICGTYENTIQVGVGLGSQYDALARRTLERIELWHDGASNL